MKLRTAFVVFLCSFLTSGAFAHKTGSSAKSNIAAFVNESIITHYDVKNRTQMLLLMHKIDKPTKEDKEKFKSYAMESLIDQELILDHANKMEMDVSQKEVDMGVQNFSRTIGFEGSFAQKIKKSNIDFAGFESYVKAEIVKSKIFSSISNSIDISEWNKNKLIIGSDVKDVVIDAYIYTSQDKTPSALAKMKKFRRYISNPRNFDKMKDSAYNKFADLIAIEDRLASLDRQLMSIAAALNPGNASGVFESDDGYSVMYLKSRNIADVSDEEDSYIKNILFRQKMDRKAAKFFKDLRTRAFIKKIDSKN